MSQVKNISIPAPHHPVPAFQSLLAIGAMLATLAVIAYAGLHTDDSAQRVRIILQGFEVIGLVWSAGAVASLLHLLGVADEVKAHAADAVSANA